MIWISTWNNIICQPRSSQPLRFFRVIAFEMYADESFVCWYDPAAFSAPFSEIAQKRFRDAVLTHLAAKVDIIFKIPFFIAGDAFFAVRHQTM